MIGPLIYKQPLITPYVYITIILIIYYTMSRTHLMYSWRCILWLLHTCGHMLWCTHSNNPWNAVLYCAIIESWFSEESWQVSTNGGIFARYIQQHSCIHIYPCMAIASMILYAVHSCMHTLWHIYSRHTMQVINNLCIYNSCRYMV